MSNDIRLSIKNRLPLEGLVDIEGMYKKITRENYIRRATTSKKFNEKVFHVYENENNNQFKFDSTITDSQNPISIREQLKKVMEETTKVDFDFPKSSQDGFKLMKKVLNSQNHLLTRMKNQSNISEVLDSAYQDYTGAKNLPFFFSEKNKQEEKVELEDFDVSFYGIN